MLICCPADTTDLVAVIGCDLGRVKKNMGRFYCVEDFNEKVVRNWSVDELMEKKVSSMGWKGKEAYAKWSYEREL